MGATVLHRQHLNPRGSDMIATLSQMYVPMFGNWTKALFLAGVWAVLFKTLYVATAGHSRMTADFLQLARFVDYRAGGPQARQRWITILCIAIPLGALALYLIFGEPRAMVIFGGFFQGITLPVITGIAVIFRYRRCDPRLAPSRVFDLWLWAAMVSITLVAIYATWERLSNQIIPDLMTLFGGSGA
jgi:Mn2+/Fe2+ NRAMP family transporter